MTSVAFNVTSIGASHIRVGKECQDFSYSEQGEGYAMAISCDGHGGDNYFRSAYGSRFAAQSAAACISEFLQDWDMSIVPDNPDVILTQLEKSIITQWNIAVWDHYEANPFTEEELNSVSEHRRKRLLSGKSIESTYGSTLIALVQTEMFWFGIQIGDGKAVRISADGVFDQPIPANEKCFLNSTTSICDENAIEDFRHAFSTEMPAALFCGSDGIDDSFIRDEQLYKLYSTIGRSFVDGDRESACAELEDYLPRLSSKGSGDDVSIAGIVTIDIAGTAIPEIVEPAVPEPPVEDAESDGEQGNEVEEPAASDLPIEGAESDEEQGDEVEDGELEQTGASVDENAAGTGLESDAGPVQQLELDSPDQISEDSSGAEDSDGEEITAGICIQTTEGTYVGMFSTAGADDSGALAEALADQTFNIPISDGDKESDAALVDGPAASEPTWSPRFCEECGYEFPGPVKFCPECGTKVEKRK